MQISLSGTGEEVVVVIEGLGQSVVCLSNQLPGANERMYATRQIGM